MKSDNRKLRNLLTLNRYRLSEHIRNMRLLSGMSIEEMAEATEVDLAALMDFEMGRFGQWHKLERLLGYMGKKIRVIVE